MILNLSLDQKNILKNLPTILSVSTRASWNTAIYSWASFLY